MFIEEIISGVSTNNLGQKSCQRTLKSKFKRFNAEITSIYSADKLITRRYQFEFPNKVIKAWKTIVRKEPPQKTEIHKSVDIKA